MPSLLLCPPPLFGVAGLGSGVPSLCWAPLALPGGGEKYTAGVGFGTESERGQEEEPGGVRCALSSGSFALTSCLPGTHSFIQPVCVCRKGTLGSTLDTQPQLSPVTGRNALFTAHFIVDFTGTMVSATSVWQALVGRGSSPRCLLAFHVRSRGAGWPLGEAHTPCATGRPLLTAWQ